MDGTVNINKGGCVGECGCIYVCNISLGIIGKGIHDFSDLCFSFRWRFSRFFFPGA